MSGNASGTIPLAPPGTGMISSASPFVAPDFTPTPLSFRFLFELWRDCGDYERRLSALEAKLGVTDGSNATAGQVGEYLAASASGSVLSATATDIVTLTLSAGDWDVAGSVNINPSATGLWFVQAWLSPSANTPVDPGRSVIESLTTTSGTLNTMGMVVGPVRFSVAAPSTLAVHLGCQANYPSGTPAGTTSTADAWIRARRAR